MTDLPNGWVECVLKELERIKFHPERSEGTAARSPELVEGTVGAEYIQPANNNSVRRKYIPPVKRKSLTGKKNKGRK